MTTTILEILSLTPNNQNIFLQGWVRTHRISKNISFIALNDGSTIENIQIVVELEKFNNNIIKKINTGAAISINGILSTSTGNKQSLEVLAESII